MGRKKRLSDEGKRDDYNEDKGKHKKRKRSKKHNDKENAEYTERDSEMQFECYCGCKFSKKQSFEFLRHLSVFRHGVQCSKCRIVLKTENDLRNHIRSFTNHSGNVYFGQLPTAPSDLAPLIKRKHIPEDEALKVVINILKGAENYTLEYDELHQEFKKITGLKSSNIVPPVQYFMTFLDAYPTVFSRRRIGSSLRKEKHTVITLIQHEGPDSFYDQLQPTNDAEFSDTESNAQNESMEETIQNLITEFYANGSSSMLKMLEKCPDLDLVLFTLRGLECYLFEKKEISLETFGNLMLNKIQNCTISKSNQNRASRIAEKLGEMPALQNLIIKIFQLEEEKEKARETIEQQIVPIPEFDTYSQLSMSTLLDYEQQLNKRDLYLKSMQKELNSGNVDIIQLESELNIEKEKQTMYLDKILVIREQLAVLEKIMNESKENEIDIEIKIGKLQKEQKEQIEVQNKYKEDHFRDLLYLRELQVAFKTMHS